MKYAVDESFFDTWSNEMAYTLGFWYADGSLEHSPAIRGKYIRVGCTDKEVIQSIKYLMSSDHTIVQSDKGSTYKKFYLLRIGNQNLFNALIALGVTERKSKTISLPSIPDEYFSDFIRGYFDGDGCVYLEPNEKDGFKRMTTIFTSGSKEFLLSLEKQLIQMKVLKTLKKINVTKNKQSVAYQLRYSTRDSLRLYQFFYPPYLSKKLYLKRKRDLFEKYIKAREIKKDDFENILDTVGPIII